MDHFPSVVDTILAVNEAGVGVGQHCGAPPTYYLRDVASFVVPPLNAPAPPGPGTGIAVAVADSSVSTQATRLAVLALATGLSLAVVIRRRRSEHQRD